jgi:voltage-gated potassium channel
MTQLGPSMPTSLRHAWRLILFMLLRITLSLSFLFVAYYQIPTGSLSKGSDVPWLILELGVFGIVVGVQVPAIVRAKYPILRAVEALAILIPLFLLIFARIYLSSSLNDPSAFNLPLDNTTALYFTVTVFATVGFGDIVANTNNMRLLVSLQMLLNLAVLGIVIRLLTSAARRGVARRGAQPGADGTDRLSD